MPDSNLYLKEAVERLLTGLETITDSDGDLIITDTQAFMIPYPTGTEWAAANQFGLVRQETAQNPPFVEQSWNVPIRVGIGNLHMELEGIQQEKVWEWSVLVINWITEHPHLQFAEANDELDYLDTTTGVSVVPGSVQARVESPETGKILRFDITVQIPFRVHMNIIKYQDGQIIEV